MKKLRSFFQSDKVESPHARPTQDERRVQPRFTAQFRSTFSGSKQEGQGRTVDISAGGCKLESDMKVEQGATFECRLHIPGLDWPVRIDEATVRWVGANSFGFAFSRIAPGELVKLTSVLADLEEGE
ncbi:MAG: PilZ domain-containing protein [Nitrospira sp.]|nr:PilZ domain-containing protein [Nitrospira sp.]MDH4305613.1 PilZ domain-containing protein [Nitrospira sp.]MDH5195389.1 PilZ domain-containing protein [Nitrospira sp.]